MAFGQSHFAHRKTRIHNVTSQTDIVMETKAKLLNTGECRLLDVDNHLFILVQKFNN